MKNTKNTELILANTIEAKNKGIEIDTLCLTKMKHVVQVKSFNAGYKGPGYCITAQPWNSAYYLDRNWTYVVTYLADGFLSGTPISNYHKISALTPISSLNTTSAADFIEKYGMQAYKELQFFSTFKRTYKENDKKFKEKMKKIREAAQILKEFALDGESAASKLCQSK